MDGNHQDKVESKLTATEDTKWVLSKKNKLWIPKHKRRTEFEDKTRWDWLQLIIQAIGAIVISISIVIGVWQFTTQQQNDLMRSIDEQQQTTLQNYLGTMSDLLLKENLRGSKPEDVVRQVAEAQTLTALQNLNPARKGILVIFLYESHLIGYYDFTNKSLQRPIIALTSADLSGADLRGAFLGGADLRGATLSGADLSDAFLGEAFLNAADLSDANLSVANLSDSFLGNADLSDANLSNAFLSEANLSNAFLGDADLSNAILSEANLSDADLSDANLSNADLSDANLSDAFLGSARDLSQHQLDQVYLCQGTILPQGLACHRTQ